MRHKRPVSVIRQLRVLARGLLGTGIRWGGGDGAGTRLGRRTKFSDDSVKECADCLLVLT